MVPASGVKVFFGPLHRWFYSLVLSPQSPPLGMVVRFNDGSNEHLPSPLIDHVAETVENRFYAAPFTLGRLCLILRKRKTKKQATKNVHKIAVGISYITCQRPLDTFCLISDKFRKKFRTLCWVGRCNKPNCSHKSFRQSQKAWQVSLNCYLKQKTKKQTKKTVDVFVSNRALASLNRVNALH